MTGWRRGRGCGTASGCASGSDASARAPHRPRARAARPPRCRRGPLQLTEPRFNIIRKACDRINTDRNTTHFNHRLKNDRQACAHSKTFSQAATLSQLSKKPVYSFPEQTTLQTQSLCALPAVSRKLSPFSEVTQKITSPASSTETNCDTTDCWPWPPPLPPIQSKGLSNTAPTHARMHEVCVPKQDACAMSAKATEQIAGRAVYSDQLIHSNDQP